MRPYLNDHWTNEIQLLNREPFALAVRDLIMHADTPFAMSIGGRWGSGKTSMLRTLMEMLGGIPVSTQGSLLELEKDRPQDITDGKLPPALHYLDGELLKPGLENLKHIRPIWFNPWHYQNEDNPIVPLLHEIREQVREHHKLSTWIKDESKTLKHLAEAGLLSLGNLIDQAASLLAPKKIELAGKLQTEYRASKERDRQNSFAAPVDAQRFFLQFQKAIEQLVGGNKDGRLIIFIDDLDRCENDTVFRLLEAIKLYLSSRHCVFVFGLDSGHVENAITKASDFRSREAAHYVEKLFQVRLSLPVPDKKTLRHFIAKHVLDLQLGSALSMQKMIIKNFCTYLPPNPRLIKNTLNGLKMYAELLRKKDPQLLQHAEGWRRLCLVHLFRTFYPDAYEAVMENIDAGLDALGELVKNGFKPEPSNGTQLYLRRVMMNPLYHPPLASGEDGFELDDEQFRSVRAGVWQAHAFSKFQSDFIEAFTPINAIKEERFRDYSL